MASGTIIDVDGLRSLLATEATGRRLVAVAGAPGSGKSTLTERLVADLDAARPGTVAVLPMDGYHFDDRVLVARGLRPRKGAPETFDVGGLRHMLARLKADEEDEVAVPVFDRDIEIARAAARVIPRSTRVVVVEGNYLLLGRAPWSDLRPFFNVTVMISVPEKVRRARLTARWDGYGLSPEEVREKLDGNDMLNGNVVENESLASDWVIEG